MGGKWQIGLSILSTLLITPVSAATIFKSVSPDGIEQYATEALDASYKPHFSDNAEKSDLYKNNENYETNQLPNTPFLSVIKHFANKHEIDALLIYAIITVESQFNPHAVSPKGASGLMQLMPATAAHYGVKNINDPNENIEAGVRYLKDLLKLHNGNVALALASYNAGQGTTRKHGSRIPPYKETMLFVPAVLAKLQSLRTVKP